MSDYDARMAQLEIADAARYAARRKAEDAALGLTGTPAPAVFTGEFIPYRFMAAKPRTRCVGVGVSVEQHEPSAEEIARLASGNVTPSVRIKRGDVDTVVLVSDIRGTRENGKSRARVTKSSTVVESAAAHVQPALRHDYNA